LFDNWLEKFLTVLRLSGLSYFGFKQGYLVSVNSQSCFLSSPLVIQT